MLYGGHLQTSLEARESGSSMPDTNVDPEPMKITDIDAVGTKVQLWRFACMQLRCGDPYTMVKYGQCHNL